MTVFMTKTWGFSTPCGPLQFGTEGWRAKARAALQPGDLVIIVGTKNFRTVPAEQGLVLGIMEPTTDLAYWQDFDLPTRPEHFNDEGEYRWRYALRNRAAWKILDRRPLEEISSRDFHMDAALGIVPLTEQEAAAVMRLAGEPVELLLPVRTRARIEGEEVARRRAVPPPTTTRQGIMHLRSAPAYTYTARAAFSMAQAILYTFDQHRHRANREVIHGVPYSALEAAWIDYLSTR